MTGPRTAGNLPKLASPRGVACPALRRADVLEGVSFLVRISGGAMSKTRWAKPVLVRKPVSETAQGLGKDDDSIGGEEPVPPVGS